MTQNHALERMDSCVPKRLQAAAVGAAEGMSGHPLSGGPDLFSAFASTEVRLRHAHAVHLGYPYNLIGEAAVPPSLGGLLINNLGDPYTGSHFASEVCEQERQAVSWLMDLWECDDRESFWGSVGASGTEGNLWAIYLAREAFPQARLLYSAEAHYSIPKAARILRIAATEIGCSADGAIDPDALSAELSAQDAEHGVILALTCGTTVKGAHDDITEMIGRLERANITANCRFIHVDGALNAMVLPFATDVPLGIRPSFRHGIDSVSTSGHKMIGTPMPCGVLVARRQHVERIASAIAYLRSNDTTLMGSRNGHAVLAIWARLFGHGTAGYRRDVSGCLERAGGLTSDLRSVGVPVLRNTHAMTVVFPQPSEEIVRKYQLACHRGQAHAIVMPNVGHRLLENFRTEYAVWWEASGCRSALC